MPSPPLKSAACARVAVGAVLTGQKVRDENEGWESGTKRSEIAGIYTSGRAEGRT
jgi:hypothetical protein